MRHCVLTRLTPPDLNPIETLFARLKTLPAKLQPELPTQVRWKDVPSGLGNDIVTLGIDPGWPVGDLKWPNIVGTLDEESVGMEGFRPSYKAWLEEGIPWVKRLLDDGEKSLSA